ncbi:Rieske 2Fe-2S domain-containing protein [Paraburkholderia sacchari]|uniref:Aromatic ring-hydroxylating dioxygenase subunit alpha n=1 Tax=Paraburkholderia sacchari TaxID=159450 RepID=A0A8T6ZJ63_9BURK|nr:Rieske 2Fe-2S domain-containing protein [Paraburkholderia sacchari]NLP64871.1 aromatic ring-hydroxylating dioxygenase subunit alpha [Paraburkholderia sacchari]
MTAVHQLEKLPLQKIKAGPLPDRYARGWHCLGLAKQYADGKVHSIKAFGTKLIAFRGEDGKISVLDGYCPHMGADLSLGCVEGNTVTCAFHHWKWASDGACTEIPYAKRIPPKARLKVWPVLEQNQLLFVWNDPEGNPPDPRVEIPRINACFSDQWTDWKIVNWRIATNVRELVDNLADMAHFGPVHGQKIDYFANVFDGHVGYQMARGGHETLSDGELVADDAYFGPAYHITRMSANVGGNVLNSILLNCHVPIDQNNFELRFGVIVEKNPDLSDEENEKIADGYIELTQNAFRQDVEIWDSKTRVDNPLLCDGDGPVYQLREWYSQFYTDVENVKPVPRKIFEWRRSEGVWRQREDMPPEAESQLYQI